MIFNILIKYAMLSKISLLLSVAVILYACSTNSIDVALSLSKQLENKHKYSNDLLLEVEKIQKSQLQILYRLMSIYGEVTYREDHLGTYFNNFKIDEYCMLGVCINSLNNVAIYSLHEESEKISNGTLELITKHFFAAKIHKFPQGIDYSLLSFMPDEYTFLSNEHIKNFKIEKVLKDGTIFSAKPTSCIYAYEKHNQCNTKQPQIFMISNIKAHNNMLTNNTYLLKYVGTYNLLDKKIPAYQFMKKLPLFIERQGQWDLKLIASYNKYFILRNKLFAEQNRDQNLLKEAEKFGESNALIMQGESIYNFLLNRQNMLQFYVDNTLPFIYSYMEWNRDIYVNSLEYYKTHLPNLYKDLQSITTTNLPNIMQAQQEIETLLQELQRQGKQYKSILDKNKQILDDVAIMNKQLKNNQYIKENYRISIIPLYDKTPEDYQL